MPITRTPIVNDSGGGTDGTVIDNAWKQEFYDQIDAFAGPGLTGVWTTIAHNPGNYSADAGTWTVPFAEYAVCFLGYATLGVSVQVSSSTITGNPNLLRITLPYLPAFYALGTITCNASGPYETGVAIANPGTAILFLRRQTAAPFGPLAGFTVHASALVPLALG